MGRSALIFANLIVLFTLSTVHAQSSLSPYCLRKASAMLLETPCDPRSPVYASFDFGNYELTLAQMSLAIGQTLGIAITDLELDSPDSLLNVFFRESFSLARFRVQGERQSCDVRVWPRYTDDLPPNCPQQPQILTDEPSDVPLRVVLDLQNCRPGPLRAHRSFFVPPSPNRLQNRQLARAKAAADAAERGKGNQLNDCRIFCF